MKQGDIVKLLGYEFFRKGQRRLLVFGDFLVLGDILVLILGNVYLYKNNFLGLIYIEFLFFVIKLKMYFIFYFLEGFFDFFQEQFYWDF